MVELQSREGRICLSWRIWKKRLLQTEDICLLKERLLSKIKPRSRARSVGEMLVEQKEIEDEMFS